MKTHLSLLVLAALVLAAFRAWKRWQDAATYDWPTAAFRWVQGALFGILAAFGVASL